MSKLSKSVFVPSFVLTSLIGCGGDEPAEPSIGELAVHCTAAPSDSGADRVVETVSVVVSDPDRDLTEVTGQINTFDMTLEDEDADQRYTWSPPSDASEPMVCGGEFHMIVVAKDRAGNTVRVEEFVEGE